ncbi:serine/threonine-protein kinase chk-1-like [Oratosquilla oratoria]|uniref:serine/threonine-protein kinase chk-1-like n=1 Tax=Oratosquilla oratoria TaxID=337810 RepID=UPI003F775DC8
MTSSRSDKEQEEEQWTSGGSSRSSSAFGDSSVEKSSVEESSYTEDSFAPFFKTSFNGGRKRSLSSSAEEGEESACKKIKTSFNKGRKRSLSYSAEEEESALKKIKSFEEPKNDWIQVKELGEGAYGSVVLLKKATSEVFVAKKSIELEDDTNQEIEVQVQESLEHRNILRVLSSEKDETHIHIYLEYANGGDLSRKIGPSGLDEKTSVLYFNQLISGVKYMHTHGVVHRDLKPRNLLLNGDNVLKIADFGLAAKLEDRKTYLSEVCGTRGYMAPEVFSARYRGEPSDVWSCGVTLVKMLSGRAPWEVAKSYDPNYQIWLLKGLVSLDSKPWTLICKSAMELIESLLHPDPSGRATIQEIEQHDFVAN